jgi:hypothetical protein
MFEAISPNAPLAPTPKPATGERGSLGKIAV